MPKVMIAEDDLVTADLLEDILTESGYEVCGIARTVEEGHRLGRRHRPDLAVLDLRLANGGLGTDIAAGFGRQNRPGVLYATGNGGQLGLTNADGEACLGKPYRSEDVVRGLQIVAQIISTGQASPPFPARFCVLERAPMSDTGAKSFHTETNQTRRLRRQQAALAKFGGYALSETNFSKVLTEAARVCAEGLDVPFCKVCRYRAEENDLLVEAGVGWHQGVIGHVISRADASSPQGRAFITGEPVICNDLRTDKSFALPPFYAEHGIISMVDVIIRKEGRHYGVLEVDSPMQHDYDQHDIDFLTGFANVLAEAVSTSERNLALLAANTALTSALNRMEEMVAARDRLLEAQNELLAEKHVLAQELQHRVRNNLHLVHGMLSKQLKLTTDPIGREGLSAIARRVMTLAQVYDHLLGTGLSKTIDFGTYLSSLCSSIESLQTDRPAGVRLICHAEPIILDLDCVTALGLVTSELISNCYNHAFPAGKGTISVSLSRGPMIDEGTIVFADDGVGMQEDGDSKRHGLGLVRRLMQQIDGSASLRSDLGTEWTISFPVKADAGMLGNAS